MIPLERLRGRVNRVVELPGTEFWTIDHLPYKFKNRELYYDREHKKELNPRSMTYKKYWRNVLQRAVEGKWIYDLKEGAEEDQGTWVYVPPKLSLYLDVVRIMDNGNDIAPRMRDQEMIMAYYYFIMDGFSGFEGDDVYTCNEYVRKIQMGIELELHEEKKFNEIKADVTSSNGELKKYVDPWIYLTEWYTVVDPQGKPLGLPLYQNQRKNSILMASRALGKSFYLFLGDFMHEFLLNGIRRMEDLKDINSKLLFGIAALDEEALNRSVGRIEEFLNKMPGKYEPMSRYLGAFGKNLSGGEWKSGNTIKHTLFRKNNTKKIAGNEVQIRTIKPNKVTKFSGDRFRRIYIEEGPFIENLTAIHSASENSLKSGTTYVGSMCIIGTGGSQTGSTANAKMIYENPGGYNMASMPDPYKRGSKTARSGLFIPVIYAYEDYKDSQGNTKHLESLEFVVRQRLKEKAEKDSADFLDLVMFNPILPKEMLISKVRSRFPIAEMSDHKQRIIDREYEAADDDSEAMVSRNFLKGWLEWDEHSTNGVSFELDWNNKLEEITNWGQEDKYFSLKGAFMVYEDVMEDAPDGLYYVIVDPVANSGTGSSLNSVLVYKADYIGDRGGMRDNIVAEWTGRLDELNDTHEMFIKIAKYYNNAKIFVERNVANFLEYCRDNQYFHMLYGEPLRTLNLIQKTNVKPSYWGKGVRMNNTLNTYCYLELAQWFKEVVEKDKDGIVVRKRLHDIKSLRILSEAINYDPDDKTKFDAISSLYLVMLLRIELKEQQLELNFRTEDEDEAEYLTSNYRRYQVSKTDNSINFLDI